MLKLIKKNILKEESIFVFLFISIAIPMLILSFYNHPFQDDYGETNAVLRMGFWQAQKYWYLKWTGRYFALFIISLNPLVYHFYWGYKLNVIILVLLMSISVFALIHEVFRQLELRFIIGLSALILFASFLCMPDIQEGLFWQSDAYATYVPSIMTVLLLTVLIKYYRSKKKRFLCLAGLLCTAIIGSYEIFLVITDVLAFLLVGYFALRRKINKPAIIIFAICIIASIISITAPGNYIRGNTFPNHYLFLRSVAYSLKYGLGFVHDSIIFILFIYFISFNFVYKKIKIDDEAYPMLNAKPYYVFLFMIFVPVIGLFPLYWTKGIKLPESRVVNIIYFYFLLSAIYFFLCTLYYLKKRLGDSMPMLPTKARLAGYVFLIFAAFIYKPFDYNMYILYKDIVSGKAAKFNTEITGQEKILRTNPSDSCKVLPVTDIPKSLPFNQINPGNWWYPDICQFYNKKAIIVVK